jgi:hypothetical protein
MRPVADVSDLNASFELEAADVEGWLVFDCLLSLAEELRLWSLPLDDCPGAPLCELEFFTSKLPLCVVGALLEDVELLDCED